ncbi:glycosyltransferase [Hamadaea tsunoensis]|uniref:glycosyltransferase n=1 Tax=Hamadaea tsunoensis TaxID=53368 RepID=UPI001B7FACE0|nr:glycosyltransferase [Hamadaea tsunoensis]
MTPFPPDSVDVTAQVPRQLQVHDVRAPAETIDPATRTPVKPTFSVCIAVRDRSALLVNSIQSVFATGAADVEVVVVDDGSGTPSQEGLADAGLLADERIRLVRRPARGIAAARNTALAVARGRYITVLDSDDELTADAFDHLRGLLDATGAPWVYTDYEEITNSSQRVIRMPAYQSPPEMLRAVLTRPRLPFKHSGMTIDRRVLTDLGGYNEDMRIKVDVELVLRALRHDILPVRLGEPVVKFRRHDSNISHKRLTGLGAWYGLISEYAPRRSRLRMKAYRTASEIAKWGVSAVGR